jgi:hypothetical protein
MTWLPPEPEAEERRRVQGYSRSCWNFYYSGLVDYTMTGELPKPRDNDPRLLTMHLDFGPDHCQIRVIKYDRDTGDVIEDQVM